MTVQPETTNHAGCCPVCSTPLAVSLAGAPCPRCLLNLAGEGTVDEDSAAESAALLGRKFGDYELLEEISRGGMGVVYRARQRSLKREVALKLILSGELAGPAARRMFQTEALAAAALHHPNIVAVYDSGECDLQPFIAMCLVPGRRNIAQWAAEHRAAGAWRLIAEKAALVARAVAHAHERGVLHRDLKPSNILWDDQAGPQVTDFGLAKIMNAAGDQVTLSAQMLGSPGYMAPEQAGEGGEEITTATDVYGIGAVLYELLSGTPPFTAKSALETIRKVREESPPPLKNAPRDLATVCFKCLSRHPKDRYASALALAQELERFARGEPVLAVPLPLLPRLWRWAKRKPAIAALLAVTTLAVLGGVGGILWQWREAEAARGSQAVALQAAESANAAQREAIHHLRWQEMDHQLSRGDAAGALARAAAFIRANPADRSAAMFAMSIVDQHSFPMLAAPEITSLTSAGVAPKLSPDGRWVAHAAVDLTVRVFEASTGKEVASIRQPRTEGSSGKAVNFTAIAIGNQSLALATGEGQLTLRPLPSGTPPIVLCESAKGAVIWELEFSADGSRLMARTKDDVRIWNAAAPGAPLAKVFFGETITGAALAMDGASFLAWSARQVGVWKVADGSQVFSATPPGGCDHGAISSDGKWIALTDRWTEVSVWNVERQQQRVPTAGQWKGEMVALNADGTRLLTHGNGIPVALYDTVSGYPVAENLWTQKTSHASSFRYPFPRPWLAAAADRHLFATTGLDNTVLLWDAASGRMETSPVRLGAGQEYPTMHLSPDGSRILTHSRIFRGLVPVEARLALWKQTNRLGLVRHRPPDARIGTVCLSPDGAMAAACISHADAAMPPTVRVTDTATGNVVMELPCSAFPEIFVFSPDGKQLHAILSGSPVRAVSWSLETKTEVWNVSIGQGLALAADVSPDGQVIVAGLSDIPKQAGRLIFLNADNGSERANVAIGEIISVVRFAPDGSGRVLVGGNKGGAQVWNSAKAVPLMTFPGTDNDTTAAAWSADAKRIATVEQSKVTIWNAETGQPIVPALGTAAWISHLEFSPDGRSLVAVGRDGTLQLWDPRTGDALSPLRRQGTSCETVRFLQDGSAFVVMDTTGFRYWDPVTMEPVTVHYQAATGGIGTQDCPGIRAILSPDGRRIITGSLSPETGLWTVTIPQTEAPAWFPGFLECLAFTRLDDQGTASFVPGREIWAVMEAIKRSPSSEPFAAWARRVLGEQ